MSSNPTTVRMAPSTKYKLDKLAQLYSTQTEAIAVAIDRLYKDEVHFMSANDRIAHMNATRIIGQLQQEPGYINAQMVEWRESNGYIEPRIRLENEGGTWEAWANEGESVDDMRWVEAD